MNTSPPKETTDPRCEIADLYFWLGQEAETVGFTPWQTTWLAFPATMIGASDGRPYRLNAAARRQNAG